MEHFKLFLETEEFAADVKKTLQKLPKSHSKLIKDYTFHYEIGNVLKGDKKYVGEIDEIKKTIKVAAPWSYGREVCVLHEVGHAVWKFKVDAQLRKQWSQLVKKNKEKHSTTIENKAALKQNMEELFCMAYATAYAKNPPTTYNDPEWIDFIKKIPQ